MRMILLSEGKTIDNIACKLKLYVHTHMIHRKTVLEYYLQKKNITKFMQKKIKYRNVWQDGYIGFFKTKFKWMPIVFFEYFHSNNHQQNIEDLDGLYDVSKILI